LFWALAFIQLWADYGLMRVGRHHITDQESRVYKTAKKMDRSKEQVNDRELGIDKYIVNS